MFRTSFPNRKLKLIRNQILINHPHNPQVFKIFSISVISYFIFNCISTNSLNCFCGTFYCSHYSTLTRAGLLYETAKNSSWSVTGLGPLKVLNGTKLILEGHGNNLDSFRISLESFRSFRCPLLPKPVSWLGLSFAVSYNKLALKAVWISLIHWPLRTFANYFLVLMSAGVPWKLQGHLSPPFWPRFL